MPFLVTLFESFQVGHAQKRCLYRPQFPCQSTENILWCIAVLKANLTIVCFCFCRRVFTGVVGSDLGFCCLEEAAFFVAGCCFNSFMLSSSVSMLRTDHISNNLLGAIPCFSVNQSAVATRWDLMICWHSVRQMWTLFSKFISDFVVSRLMSHFPICFPFQKLYSSFRVGELWSIILFRFPDWRGRFSLLWLVNAWAIDFPPPDFQFG